MFKILIGKTYNHEPASINIKNTKHFFILKNVQKNIPK